MRPLTVLVEATGPFLSGKGRGGQAYPEFVQEMRVLCPTSENKD